MDFAWNPIMDVALNVIGYMAAGALALVVHRIFKDRSVGQVRIANASFEIGPQTEQEGYHRPGWPPAFANPQEDRDNPTGQADARFRSRRETNSTGAAGLQG